MAASAFVRITRLQLIPSCLLTSISFQSLMTSSLLWQEEKKFSKVDFANAYQQVLLDEESRELVAVNTHRGLYQFTRLPFGIASAPEVFQNLMDQILQRTGGTGCYLDDIIVTGKNDEDHLNLSVVLSRLQKYGLRLKRSNSVCVQPEVKFLGYRINKTGLHTFDKRLRLSSKHQRQRMLHNCVHSWDFQIIMDDYYYPSYGRWQSGRWQSIVVRHFCKEDAPSVTHGRTHARKSGPVSRHILHSGN